MHRLCGEGIQEGNDTMSEKKGKSAYIDIDERYAIKVVDIDYALIKRSGSGKSEQTIGYWSSIDKCLSAYLRESVHDGLGALGRTNLKEGMKVFKETLAACEERIAAGYPEYKVVKE